MEELHDLSPIEPRLRRDQAAIEEILARDRRGFVSHRSAGDRRSTSVTIDARSRPRSWRDRGENRGGNLGLFETNLKLNPSGFFAELKPPRRVQGIIPTTPSNDAHDRFNWPRSSGRFPSLKPCISLFCSSTFDRLVKKLSDFRGRSLVHRVRLAFRLDCEAIGVGLITNFSLISSNFPLEFRMSTRKNPSKFASIHENWSPILAAIGLLVRFDRLSGGNLSFY